MWILYQLLTGLLLTLAAPFLLAKKGGHYLATLRGRFGGHQGPVKKKALWLHAVSVGEVGVATTLASALRGDLLVTTVTPTGQQRALKLLSDRGSVAYLPFEFGFAIRRFFARFQPRALVLVEGDLWPLVLRRSRKEGLPILAINARISDRTFKQWARVRPVARWLYSKVDLYGVQSEQDRQRLVALGVPPERVVTTGNLKFETREPTALLQLENQLRELAQGRPILIAGSTMEGEEAALLESLRAAKESAEEQSAGGAKLASWLVVLAPRHPERFDQVAAIARSMGLALARRSELQGQPSQKATASKPLDIVLLDTLGELGAIYRVGQAAFIGGTLVPKGGHNPLEAAQFAVPVIVGPSMENFREMAAQFDQAQAWQRVQSSGELLSVCQSWQEQPQLAQQIGHKGKALIESNRGALAKTLELLHQALRDHAHPKADA